MKPYGVFGRHVLDDNDRRGCVNQGAPSRKAKLRPVVRRAARRAAAASGRAAARREIRDET